MGIKLMYHGSCTLRDGMQSKGAALLTLRQIPIPACYATTISKGMAVALGQPAMVQADW